MSKVKEEKKELAKKGRKEKRERESEKNIAKRLKERKEGEVKGGGRRRRIIERRKEGKVERLEIQDCYKLGLSESCWAGIPSL